MKILASSTSIRRAVSNLLAPGRTRRVAITAFIGEGARTFIRSPKGVEIICWPKAGGTNPDELRKLKQAGARIRFADRLHMKLYWAGGRGAIVTSANLSKNALGAGDLKEFGVLLSADSVPIDDVIESLKSRRFNIRDMQSLEHEHRKLKARQRRRFDRVSYLEWSELPARPEWKLGWWDRVGAISKTAKGIAKNDFNVRSPEDFVSCRKGDYRKSDWVLAFRLTDKGASSPNWIYVDFCSRVGRGEKEAYDAAYPYQAVQVSTSRYYPLPPFAITRSFRAALREASMGFGINRIKGLRGVRPSVDLLKLIKKNMLAAL
jgi:hypothetical protein